MRLRSVMILVLFVAFTVEGQRSDEEIPEKKMREERRGLIESLLTSFSNYMSRPRQTLFARILNPNRSDNDRRRGNENLEMLDDEVETIAPSVNTEISSNFIFGDIFGRIFQIPIAALESVRNMVVAKNRLYTSVYEHEHEHGQEKGHVRMH